MLKLGIVGCGAIGSELVKSIVEGELEGYKVIALLDINKEKALKLAKMLGDESIVVESIDELLERNPDIVVEAASPTALKLIAEKVLKAGKTLVSMSSGAFLDREFFDKVMKLLEQYEGEIRIPSGAIGGVDMVKAISNIGGSVKLITIKSKEAFKKAKKLPILGLNLEEVKDRTLVFKGKASEAIKYFPTMINVSATLSLAFGRDIDVEMYVDPTIHYTIHEIVIESDATSTKIIIDNKHHPRNPRTSYLAPLSLIELLKEFNSKMRIGT